MQRRKKIRLISFLSAFFAVCIAWAVSSTVKASKYETQTRLSQQRAVMQLCEYLSGIETALTKSRYASSGKMLASLSNDLGLQSSGAKNSLSALSAGDTQLYNIYKFLSQVSDYTSNLNAKAAAGEKITAKERQTLNKLLSYSKSLSGQFTYISELLNSNRLSFEELDRTLTAADKAGESMTSFMSAASDAEESMKDYPSLIYDGPFSDNILNKESEMLKNAKKISRTDAKSIAAKLLGANTEKLTFDGETQSKLASYTFVKGLSRIAVTVNGGYPVYIITDYSAGEEKLTHTDCIEKASAFLYKCGYKNMVSSYYSCFDGVCTVNFAYMQDNYICYPDLIKVGISLTDGTVVSLDASDFLMNHRERAIPEPMISYEDAEAGVENTLTVKNGYYAVIPAKDGREYFTYELLCEDKDSTDVLVYTDTVTGEQDDILILLYSDNGTLTK